MCGGDEMFLIEEDEEEDVDAGEPLPLPLLLLPSPPAGLLLLLLFFLLPLPRWSRSIGGDTIRRPEDGLSSPFRLPLLLDLERSLSSFRSFLPLALTDKSLLRDCELLLLLLWLVPLFVRTPRLVMLLTGTAFVRTIPCADGLFRLASDLIVVRRLGIATR